jgi:asparagine synthase (glutamine-hydrolysing)
VLLSGGVDSRLILAGLCRLLDLPGSSFDTFTFRYADYRGVWNENEPARATAEHFGTRHHEIAYGPRDVAAGLDWMLRAYGEPFSFGLHSSMLRDVAATGVRALLNGAGPDGWYLDPRNDRGLRYARLPRPLRAALRGSAGVLRRLGSASRPRSLWRLYAAAGDLGYAMEPAILCGETGRPARCTGIILSEELRRRLYTDSTWVDQADRAADALFESARADFGDESPRDTVTFLHRHFVNAEGTLHWNHWWGRAHGITVRFPYFDGALLAFANRLPRRGRDKDEVRAFAATLMPHEMACAPKIPQTIPIRAWLRGPLRDFLQDQLAPARLAKQGFFEPSEVERLVKEHLKGGMAHEWKLWVLLAVTAWEDLASRGGL